MSRCFWSMIVCLTLSSTAAFSSAEAQPLSGSGMIDRIRGAGVLINFLLLEQPAVQQELRVTPEQVQAVRALGERQRAQLEGLSQLPQGRAAEKLQQAQATTDAELRRILSEGQHQRLTQIALQQAGPLAGLSHPEVSQALGLTAEQKSELHRLREDLIAQASASAPMGGLRRGGLLAGVSRLKEAKQQADAKAFALLTAEQRTQWQLRQGEPFRGEINPGLGQGGPAGRLRSPRR